MKSYTRGRVAAGLAVVLSLEVLARREGAVREVVRVVAEDGITEVIVMGEVNDSSRGSCNVPFNFSKNYCAIHPSCFFVNGKVLRVRHVFYLVCVILSLNLWSCRFTVPYCIAHGLL